MIGNNTSRTFRPKGTKIFGLCLGSCLLLMAGCSSMTPWVKPYERSFLADPIMSFDPDPLSATYMHHVYQSREGARGAEGGGGGGCGCN